MERRDLLDKLIEKNLTLSCMESLTGGLFASAFTSIPNASKVFKGGIVTYTDKVKEYFGIPRSIIESFGAISKECAREMCLKASLHFESDCAISFTGNAGPSADEGKEIGLVYIAIKVSNSLVIYTLNFKGDRRSIREQCVDFAFNKLYEKLTSEDSVEENK